MEVLRRLASGAASISDAEVTIADFFNEDAKLDADLREWLQNFFAIIQITTIAELRDIEKFQPAKGFLHDRLNEYTSTYCTPADTRILSALGRLVRSLEQEHTAVGPNTFTLKLRRIHWEQS